MLTREPLLTHEETIAKILAEFDARIWKTADDACQLRLLSRYEVECIRRALAALGRDEGPAAWLYENPKMERRFVMLSTPQPDERASWKPLYLTPPGRDEDGERELTKLEKDK